MVKEKYYELLFNIQKDIEKTKEYVSELQNTEQKRLNSIQEAVVKRVREKFDENNDSLTLDVEYATKKFTELKRKIYTAERYLDEIGNKVLEVEKLIKED